MPVVMMLLFLLALSAPAVAQEVTFTNLADAVPDRCFEADLSTVGADTLAIGIESDYNPTNWTFNGCKASTKAFSARTVGDTFTVTVTAPPGRTIARIHYEQEGVRFLERSLYWYAQGSGQFTVNGIGTAYSFQSPTLVKTVDLSGQAVEVAQVLVGLTLQAGRSSAYPRVTAPPGSATIEVTSAVLRVEYE